MLATASLVCACLSLLPAPQSPMSLGPLRVTVRGPDGEPRAGAMVQILRSDGDQNYLNLDLDERNHVRTVAKLPTPKSGSIGVQVPTAIPHRIRVDVEPFAIELRAGVYAGDEVDIRLRDGAVLDGIVRDDAGNPIPAERIVVLSSPRPSALRFETRAGADGRFQVTRLMPGVYHVDAESTHAAKHGGKRTTLAAGENEPIEFALDRGATMRGRITDAATGAPIVGAVLGVGWTYDKPVTTDADGRYELRGLGGPFGNNLFVKKAGYAELQIDRPEQKEGELTRDLRLERGVNVTGRIVDAAGAPVARCYVAVVGMTHDGERQQTDWLSTRTDADGRYTIGDVREALDPVLLVRHDGAATWTVDVPEATNGEVAMPDIALRARRTIQGTVRGARAEPIAGAQVKLIGTHEGAPPQTRGGSMLGHYLAERRVYSDRLGRWFVGDLGPGTYTLSYESAEQQVVVEPGEDPAPITLEH